VRGVDGASAGVASPCPGLAATFPPAPFPEASLPSAAVPLAGAAPSGDLAVARVAGPPSSPLTAPPPAVGASLRGAVPALLTAGKVTVSVAADSCSSSCSSLSSVAAVPAVATPPLAGAAPASFPAPASSSAAGESFTGAAPAAGEPFPGPLLPGGTRNWVVAEASSAPGTLVILGS